MAKNTADEPGGTEASIAEISRLALATSVAVTEDIYAHSTPNVFEEADEKIKNRSFFVSKWGTEGYNSGQSGESYSVAVASDGSVYVADPWNHPIQKFTSAGVFVNK